jgi:hypothetical protein
VDKKRKGKGKGKIQENPVSLTKHYAMEAHGGVDAEIHIFLTSVIVGG